MTRAWLVFALKIAVIAAAITLLITTDTLRLGELRVVSGGWPIVAAAALVMLAHYILTQVRLWILLRGADIRIAVGRVIRIGLISWFLNATLLGGLGFLSDDALRAAYLMKESDRRSPIVGVILLDRTIGLAGLLLMPGLVLLATLHQFGESSRDTLAVFIYLPLVFLALFLTAAGICVIAFDRLTLLQRLRKKAPRIGAAVTDLVRTIADYRQMPGVLTGAFLTTMFIHVLSALIIFLLSLAIAIAISPSLGQVFFAAPIAFLTAVIPLPANGLGAGEVALDFLLRLTQDPGAAALSGGAALYLSFRIVSMTTALIGLPFFLTHRKSAAPPPAV